MKNALNNYDIPAIEGIFEQKNKLRFNLDQELMK